MRRGRVDQCGTIGRGDGMCGWHYWVCATEEMRKDDGLGIGSSLYSDG